MKYPLEIKEITDGLLFEDEQFTVEARELEHGIQSFGFRIVEKDRPGTLLVEKLKQLGIKPGPQYRQIKEGSSVTLEDGTVLDAHHFLGPRQLGRIVAILGDTRKCQGALELAKEADLLVHEATFAADDGVLAYDYFHSTTKHAAETAQEAGAKKLCLTHISSRYDRNAAQELLHEARAIFPETEIAEDFKSITVPRI